MIIGNYDDAVNAIESLKLYIGSNMSSFNKKDFVTCNVNFCEVDYIITRVLYSGKEKD